MINKIIENYSIWKENYLLKYKGTINPKLYNFTVKYFDIILPIIVLATIFFIINYFPMRRNINNKDIIEDNDSTDDESENE